MATVGAFTTAVFCFISTRLLNRKHIAATWTGFLNRTAFLISQVPTIRADLATIFCRIGPTWPDLKWISATFAFKSNRHDWNRKCPPVSTPEASPYW